MANLTSAAQTRKLFTAKPDASSLRGLQLLAENTGTSRPSNGRIPEPLLSALLEAGYNGTDDFDSFVANLVNAHRIFRVFQFQTPSKPWKTIEALMNENLELKREANYLRRHITLHANIYDYGIAQWYKLEEWLAIKGLEVPKKIQDIGREARMALLRAEGLAH